MKLIDSRKSLFWFLFLNIILINAAIAQNDTVKLYRVLNQDMNLAKPVSFLSPITGFWSLEKPNPPLSLEEGSDGFLVDSQFFIKFPAWEKRYYEKGNPKNERIKPFFGYSRIYIDYGFSSRIADNIKSSPSLPITNRYGIRWDKVFKFRYNYGYSNGWDSVRVWSKSNCESNKTVKSFNLVKKNVKYRFWYATAYLHHYSNGGTVGVLDSLGFRNDYVNGDHSTSFFRFSIGRQVHNGMKSHQAYELGYQMELGDTSTFFTFPIEQENNYGRHRLVGNYQYILGIQKGFIEYIKFRTDIQLILGNLYKFPYDDKYRLNTHLYIDAGSVTSTLSGASFLGVPPGRKIFIL